MRNSQISSETCFSLFALIDHATWSWKLSACFSTNSVSTARTSHETRSQEMRNVIRTLLMSGRKPSPASLPAIATLTVLFAGAFLPHPAAAQDSTQTLTTPVLSQATALARNSSPSRSRQASCSCGADKLGRCSYCCLSVDDFQFRAGAWLRPDRSRPGVQSVPSARVYRHHSPSIVFRTAPFRHQS